VTFLLDVNVLMALLWENHEHHAKARSWLKQIPSFATCPVAQLGFARVSSHPLLGFGMKPEDAFSVLRRFLADPRHRFLPDDLSCGDRVRNCSAGFWKKASPQRGLCDRDSFSITQLDETVGRYKANQKKNDQTRCQKNTQFMAARHMSGIISTTPAATS
jgi:hypothetical protein